MEFVATSSSQGLARCMCVLDTGCKDKGCYMLLQVIELCKSNGIPVHEKNFSLVETYSADEAFLTGSFGAQTPVSHIDGRRIGSGELGPVTTRLRGLYKELVGAG